MDELDIKRLQSMINKNKTRVLLDHLENADDELEEKQAALEYRSMIYMLQEEVLNQAETNLQLRMEVIALKQQVHDLANNNPHVEVKIPNALGI